MKLKILLFMIVLFLFPIFSSAHAGENHKEISTDTGTLTLIVIGAILSTIVPLFLGFNIARIFEKQESMSKDKFLIPSGLSLGFLLFLLFDFSSLSTLFAFQTEDLIYQTLKLFLVIGLLILFSNFVSDEGTSSFIKVSYIWVTGIIVHTVGEGIIMGYNLTQGLGFAFALLPITSYMMHKFVEGVIGSVILTQEDELDKNLMKKFGFITGLSIIPSVFLGYFSNVLHLSRITNIINVASFIVGFSTVVFILPFLIPPHDKLTKENYFVAVGLGLLYMYVAVIFHEF